MVYKYYINLYESDIKIYNYYISLYNSYIIILRKRLEIRGLTPFLSYL